MKSTTDYILEKVAPIFNQKGYVGTSLSDITKATNLTKGAIYCNFKNKEELAMKAFQLNLKNAVLPLQVKLRSTNNSIKKLLILTDYYRNYYNLVQERGGCPILNVGIDAKLNNYSLFNESKRITNKLILGLSNIIQDGIDNKEIKENINPKIYSQNFYSMIEGGVFMALLNEDESYLINIMDMIEDIINNTLKA
ncbi:MAG: TetR/AcrR family transcriptional regulator [Flavobacteriaceae bacterium]